jgi:hypothetical protein
MELIEEENHADYGVRLGGGIPPEEPLNAYKNKIAAATKKKMAGHAED